MKALTVKRVPYREVLRATPKVYYYRIKYVDKFPGQNEFKTTAVFRNVTAIVDFMDIMMHMNHTHVVSVLNTYKAVCSCSDDIVCNCNCFSDNPIVYDVFGDVGRTMPTALQIGLSLHQEHSSVLYRIGHAPHLDTSLSHMPRFHFEVELELA